MDGIVPAVMNELAIGKLKTFGQFHLKSDSVEKQQHFQLVHKIHSFTSTLQLKIAEAAVNLDDIEQCILN